MDRGWPKWGQGEGNAGEKHLDRVIVPSLL